MLFRSVGTGFSSGVAEALFARLDAMRIRSSPFVKRLTTAEARQVRFVRPELIAEIDFRGWTGDGLLRQASFQGLRDDKPAREVVSETTMATNAAPERPKSSVTLTHPDRVYWPDAGVTKEGLADYYAEAWPFMKPFIVGRALALVRCPDGIGGQTFFQKHAWKGLNRNIVLVKDPTEPEELISIRDFDGLMALVQSAALEIHPWGSTVTDWDRPDMIVKLQRYTAPFDLTGHPTVTLPGGFGASNMPIGLQLAGCEETTLIGAAAAFQRETPWHRRHPRPEPSAVGRMSEAQSAR